MRRKIVLATLILVTMGSVLAEEPLKLVPAHWDRQPVIAVPPARPSPPKIDGYVDYKEWFYAAHVLGFLETDTGCASTYPVTMYLCYDRDALYVGMLIHRPPMNPTPRATFAPGPHEHIWWKDDNFELVVEPGPKSAAPGYGYAFCGNSIGAWSDLRYALDQAGSDASWDGRWEYKATRAGRDSWHAELKIPVSQFEGAQPPGPGVEWRLAVMNQQVTPQKKMVDWTQMWSFGQESYRSRNKARLVFVDEGPIVRFSEWGKLRPVGKDKETGAEQIGLRAVFYNQGRLPYTLNCRADLFRCPDKRPAGAMTFYDLWDRLSVVRETGKPLRDPKDPTQAFRNEADLLKELNARYGFVASTNVAITVAPGKAGYFPLQQPLQRGEYLLAWRFTDAKDGRVMASEVAPFQILPGLDLQLRPYFLTHRKVRVEAAVRGVAKTGDSVRLALRAEDKQLDAASVAVPDGAESVHTYLATDAWPEGKTGTVQAELAGADGKVCERNEASLKRPATPEWFGRNLGRSKVVPPPFEPVRCPSENTVQVWQRRYRFGENGLPDSIVSRDSELLARPMQLRLKAGDVTETGLKGGVRRVRSDDRDAVFESRRTAGELTLTTKAAVHYDGCIRFDIELAPSRPMVVEQLALEIPIAKQWASLFTHSGTSTDFAKACTDGLGGNVRRWFEKYPAGAMPFTWAFFLGGHDRGVQWFCESDRGWSNQDESKKIALVREDNSITLRVTFVDKPVEVAQPLRLNFGLIITPVKDASAGQRVFPAAFGQPNELRKMGLEQFGKELPRCGECGVNLISSYMCDPDHFGQPRMYNAEDEEFMKAFVAVCHEHGMAYRPYSGWGVNCNIPDFETFGVEMLKEPLRNAGYGCYWHNPSGTFADWWLDGARHCIEDCGFDGMYMDGTCYPELSANELDGMAWTDSAGNQHGAYPIWAIRDFIERLYVMLHCELKRTGGVDIHDGREPLHFIAGFSDTAVSGEYHLTRGKTILEVFDPDEFAAYYMTHLHGVARRFIWWNWMKLPITENEMWSMVLLHDMYLPLAGGTPKYYWNYVGYDAKTQAWVRLRKIREAFDGAEFVPYWSERKPIAAEPGGPLASAWVDKEKRRALVVVSNLATKPWQGTVRFDTGLLGVGADAEVADAMFDQPLGRKAAEPVPVAIEPQRYRLLILNDRVALPTKPKLDGSKP